MSKVSGEILINRLVEQVFDYVVDQRNEPIYNPRGADELVLGGSPEGTTAAAWPPGRPALGAGRNKRSGPGSSQLVGSGYRPGIEKAVIKTA